MSHQLKKSLGRHGKISTFAMENYLALILMGAVTASCAPSRTIATSGTGNGTAVAATSGTSNTASLTGGAVDGGVVTQAGWAPLSAAEASAASATLKVATAGGDRDFGAGQYLDGAQAIQSSLTKLGAYAAAMNERDLWAETQVLINVDMSSAALYNIPLGTATQLATAGQTSCPINTTQTISGSGSSNAACSDAFYSQANACDTALNAICTTDQSGNTTCLCNVDPVTNTISCPNLACQDDAGNGGPTCQDLENFGTCCSTTCQATAPGCYTGDQQIERGFGQYAAVSEPLANGTSIISLDRSSTLGTLNFKQSQIAYFTADPLPEAQPMRKIGTNCGVELEVTPTHPFVGIDGSIKFASSYNVGDLMLTEDGSFCEVTHLSDYDKMHGNEKTFQAFNVSVDSDELTEQVIVARGSGHGHGILTGSHWFQDHDITRFDRALARERIHAEIKP